MQLLSDHDLIALEFLHERLHSGRGGRSLLDAEVVALKSALPRWIAMERTVTEAHIDAARHATAYPDDFQDAEIYLWPNVEKVRAPWWRRLGRWWLQQLEKLEDICNQ
jgi:hypothetical protein